MNKDYQEEEVKSPGVNSIRVNKKFLSFTKRNRKFGVRKIITRQTQEVKYRTHVWKEF